MSTGTKAIGVAGLLLSPLAAVVCLALLVTSAAPSTGAPQPAPAAVADAPGERGLTPAAVAVRREVVAVFGVTNIGGWAPGSGHVNGSDHYTGRAIDIMLVPRSAAMTDLGWRIARYLQANASRLRISYLIWDARIWSPARAAEGWRPYRHPSGRGGDTLLHLDHVHVSVN